MPPESKPGCHQPVWQCQKVVDTPISPNRVNVTCNSLPYVSSVNVDPLPCEFAPCDPLPSECAIISCDPLPCVHSVNISSNTLPWWVLCVLVTCVCGYVTTLHLVHNSPCEYATAYDNPLVWCLVWLILWVVQMTLVTIYLIWNEPGIPLPSFTM